jgi:hypothetical protein
MTITSSLLIDGYDTSLIGFGLSSPMQDWRDGMWRQWEHVRIPGSISSALLNTDPKSDVRPILLRGAQEGSTVAELRSFLNLLKYRLYKSEIEIVFTDDTAVKYKARMAGRVRVTGIKRDLDQTAHTLEIPLECIDPRLYETSQQAIAVTTDTALPQGNAPVGVEFEVSVGTFTLTYKNSGGTTIKTITVTGASTPPIFVNMENKSILNSAGTPASVIADMTGDFPWDVDILEDGDFITSAWPTVSCSAGTCTARYYKAYI